MSSGTEDTGTVQTAALLWAGMYQGGDDALQASCWEFDSPPVHQKLSEPMIAGSDVAHDAPRKQGAEVEAPG